MSVQLYRMDDILNIQMVWPDQLIKPQSRYNVRRDKMKKILGFAIAGITALTMIGCSSRPQEPTAAVEPTNSTKSQQESSGEEGVPLTGTKIEFLYNLSGENISDAIQEVSEQFTRETGIEVEAVMPGSNFSDVMKIRMASNQLPDVWTTHGWAVARYSEYLRPLNDQEFAYHIMPNIQGQITGADGNLYTLPINIDLTGIVYNANVLASVGIDADDIKTWADFEAACEKIKSEGITPIQLGGKDNWTIGNMLDFVAPTIITNENVDNQKALLAGDFDWSQWNEVLEKISQWNDKEYFNKDSITADYMTGIKALAADEAAFMFVAASGITETYNVNPNAEMGFMPLPANVEGGRRSLMTGEHFAVGAWKDSEHPEEVMQFINFLAREDICAKLATVTGMPAGLDNVESDTGRLKPYYDKYNSDETILNIPYFDREYLPSGMWNDLCVTGVTVLADQPNAIKDAVLQMEESYKEKLSQQ